MKISFLTIILTLSNIALANSSASGNLDIQPCEAVIAKVSVVSLDNQETQIRTVSPLGRPRMWSLSKDFELTTDGNYENHFLRVNLSGNKISSVTIKNLSLSFNCLK